jgi:hypothetical protein
MRTLAIATVALSFVGAAAIGTTVPAQAQGFYFDAPGVHVGVGRYHRAPVNGVSRYPCNRRICPGL